MKRQIEKRTEKAREKIRSLELELARAKAQLQTLEELSRYVPRQDANGAAGGSGTFRRGSLVEKAYEAIKSHGAPLHLNELLNRMGIEPTKANRASVSGSLGAYVRRGEAFTRPEPNTFGIVEFEIGDAEEETNREALDEMFS